MLSASVVILCCLIWLSVLFAAALLADRRPAWLTRHWAWIYALSLPVYCTSWTFFGTVTQAARYQWPLPPTFVGTILLYVLGGAGIVGIVRRAREVHASSLADFIAARLGRDAPLAALVTLVAILGLIPYIALQLKAVSMGYDLLVNGLQAGATGTPHTDIGPIVAAVVAGFAILFGTRKADIGGHSQGLVFAIALESVFKLVAMLALGLFVATFEPTLPRAPAPAVTPDLQGFAPLVVLGILAMFTLPHQFHIGIVECRNERDLRLARWVFPLYMVLISLPLLPLARAGALEFAGMPVNSDLYVLALPMAQGANALALFAFLGGLAAATGMTVISLLALSLMIGNHWLAPGLLRGAWAKGGGDLRGRVLMLRRAGIIVIVLLAWIYGRAVAGEDALADVGAVSFSALATLGPAVWVAALLPGTPARAVSIGIVAGFLAWTWAMLLPILGDAGWVSKLWLARGPFGLQWLAPDSLLALTGWGRLARAVGVSLLVASLATGLAAFGLPRRAGLARRRFDAQTLRNASLRFLGPERVEELLKNAPATGVVDFETLNGVERALAGVLGSASARLLLDTAQRKTSAELETVASIVGQASQDLKFNQRVLEGALENMSQGISVVDADLKLVAWNTRYQELFGFPDGMLTVGMPIAEASGWALERMGQAATREQALSRRLAHMRAGTPHLSERVFPNGATIEIRGNPMPGGGFVATFTDVTAFRRTAADLLDINATLEQRVAERTRLLDEARSEAERANDAKSRLLAAIGHDLLQPVHAAQLFTDALMQQTPEPDRQRSLTQIQSALDATNDLLTDLFDLSRIESGGLVVEKRSFPLSELLDPLAAQFGALAGARGLGFLQVSSSAWVHTDLQLLRRIVQNFLANAVRYTPRGRIVLGVRRLRDAVRIEVHDTGTGIAPDALEMIFEEFSRGEGVAGQGLGLGLAIADRMAALLEAPLAVRSRAGVGSVFSVTVPSAVAQISDARERKTEAASLLLVDNDPLSLAALAGTLRAWGYAVSTAADAPAALQAMADDPAGAWLLDFHLDDGVTGLDVHSQLSSMFGERPTLILSADDSGVVRREVMERGLMLLRKPARALALKSVLDRLLAASRAE